MPRPPKFRRVEFLPQVTVFKPAGVPLRELEEEVLTIEELEALRLKDLEGLEQEDCAERMQVSRPTFQRVLVSAREKVARALVEGKAIRVEGGHYRLAARRFQCRACTHEFEVPFGTGQRGIEMVCPRCGAQQVHRIDQGGHGFGNMPWGRHGRGWNWE
ncbi:MAG TPA: DUF134 domain-containing protein [Firmicutes bacterium]|nr:DUF134 domain-containing protein [Bacillota bacterium]